MDQDAREDATNLLHHQYPPSPISTREELLEERALDGDDQASVTSQQDQGDRIMEAGGEEIEMADLAPPAPLSVDCSVETEEVVGKQPASVTSTSASESPSDFDMGVQTSSESSFIGRLSSNGAGIMERFGFSFGRDDEDALLISPRPTKSQVLHYFSKAHRFVIKRVERDIQITDSDGFPLFDAYADTDCAGRIWTIESYGRPVLYMRDYTATDWCQRTGRARVAVRDWNGDFFGELLPGEPFYMHDTERKVVAKLIRHGSSLAQVANGASSEESTALTTGSINAPGAFLASNKPSCWLCVQEESERHIARLEDYKSIQFNKDVAFQLKLLSLAAIIRLVGQVGLTPAANCVGVVKTILNCCAGY